MNAKQFQDKVRESYAKHFPNGRVSISPLALGGGTAIFCYLIGDINDTSGKISHNDPMTFRAYIHDNFKYSDESTELENVVVEFDGSYISVIPDNAMYYCKSHKVPVRKINAAPEKALTTLDKYFKKLKDTVTVLAKEDKIIDQACIPAKYLS